MKAITHRHGIERTTTRPYFSPVAKPGKENPAAWGNICYRRECVCGAYRDELVNGRHVERGPWVAPTLSALVPELEVP